MGKGLVLYKSKYGATKKYAQMTAEEFGADLLEIDKWKGAAEGYDWVVFCGAIYASGISGLKTLKKYCSRMKDIPLAVFCVGASPYDEKAVGEVTARNMQGELTEVPLFQPPLGMQPTYKSPVSELLRTTLTSGPNP